MDKEIKQEWVARLRSGKYRQGRDYLKVQHTENDTPAYCCLGVLCEIAIERGIVESYKEPDLIAWSFEGGETEALSPSVRKWSGIDSSLGDISDDNFHTLADLNDDRDYDFNMLADVIEKYF